MLTLAIHLQSHKPVCLTQQIGFVSFIASLHHEAFRHAREVGNDCLNGPDLIVAAFLRTIFIVTLLLYEGGEGEG